LIYLQRGRASPR